MTTFQPIFQLPTPSTTAVSKVAELVTGIIEGETRLVRFVNCTRILLMQTQRFEYKNFSLFETWRKLYHHCYQQLTNTGIKPPSWLIDLSKTKQ
jgi:hypothetical protein